MSGADDAVRWLSEQSKAMETALAELVSINSFAFRSTSAFRASDTLVRGSRAGEYTHVHLEDIAKSRVHQHLVPGDGAIDFHGLFAALEGAGYDGWVTVELYPFMSDAAGVAGRAMEYLSTLLDENGHSVRADRARPGGGGR